MQCSWKKHYALLQIIYQIKIYRRTHDIKAYPGNDQHWCRCRRFRLRGSRSLLLCVDTEVSSSLYGTAWIRTSRKVTRWARQSSEFAPDIAGTDCVFFFFFQNGGTAVAQAQPEDPDLCIGRPIAFHPEIAPPPPPDRLHPGHTDSARLGIG